MLGKLFGKKSNYYLELSEEDIEALPKPLAAAAEKIVPVVNSVTATIESPAPEKAVSKNQQTAENGSAAAQPPVETAPSPAAAPLSDPLELIRTALAASSNQSQSASDDEPEPTFSTDYLLPNATSRRRRPGPSLSPFKSMAKDMKRGSSGI
ncbi:MAG: hypothetical protein AAF282_08240 [Cyanobacteria bacterium P01_A01_bin.15]